MNVRQYLDRCILHRNCCNHISHFTLPVSRRVSIRPLFRFYLKTVRLKHSDESLSALNLQSNASCNLKTLRFVYLCFIGIITLLLLNTLLLPENAASLFLIVLNNIQRLSFCDKD